MLLVFVWISLLCLHSWNRVVWSGINFVEMSPSMGLHLHLWCQVTVMEKNFTAVSEQFVYLNSLTCFRCHANIVLVFPHPKRIVGVDVKVNLNVSAHRFFCLLTAQIFYFQNCIWLRNTLRITAFTVRSNDGQICCPTNGGLGRLKHCLFLFSTSLLWIFLHIGNSFDVACVCHLEDKRK